MFHPRPALAVACALALLPTLAGGCGSGAGSNSSSAARAETPARSQGAALIGAKITDEPLGRPGACDLVAAPDGSDDGAGSKQDPVLTAQRLADRLRTGQIGCLRQGFYSFDDTVEIDTPGIELTSFPGEVATLSARLWLTRDADGSTVSELVLDGSNNRDLPSPTINGDRIKIAGNDITNLHTGICVSVGSAETFGRAHETIIENNRIHDCGVLPANNFDHGIYVNSAVRTVIRSNWIYDNSARGIQLYPDAQDTLVTHNVIDGNGEGVIFGGGDSTASSSNVVAHNVITNSSVRHDIESSWGGPVGTGNVARDNCVGPGPPAGGAPINDSNGGFELSGNEQWNGRGPPCGLLRP